MANIVTLQQVSFAGGEFTPSLYARANLAKYDSAVKRMRNFICEVHGAATNRPGTRFIGAAKYAGSAIRLIPFQFSTEQGYILEFGHLYMRVIKDGGYVVTPSTGAIVEVVTPFTAAEVGDIKYTQSFDTLFLTHPAHMPQELTRTDHHLWAISSMTVGSRVATPTDCAGNGDSSYTPVKITAVYEGEESLANSNSIYITDTGTCEWHYPATGADYFNVYFKTAGSYGWVGRIAATDYDRIDAGLRHYTFKNSSLKPDLDITPPIAKNPFTGAGAYPGVCEFHEQRLLFARTNNRPQTIFGTQIGNIRNFNISTPLQDDDAFTFTLSAQQVNEVRWIVALEDLLVGTSSSEWKIKAGSNSDSITPTSVSTKVQSRWGSSNIRPVVIGNAVLFVEASRRRMRDAVYSLAVDGYSGNDVTLLAQHLFRSSAIRQVSYQQYPFSVVWAVMDDGSLCGLTYARDHEVFGWHRHDTAGKFKDVASISTAAGTTETYFVVERTVNGATQQYIERMEDRLPNEDVTRAWFVDCGLQYDGWNKDGVTTLQVLMDGHAGAVGDPLRLYSANGTPFTSGSVGDTFRLKVGDAYTVLRITGFTSSSVVACTPLYQAVPAALQGVATTAWANMSSTFSGLGHLEGQAVAVLADGNVVPGIVVSGGAVTLPDPACVVTLGLPYTCELETLEFEFAGPGTSLQNVNRRIVDATLRIENSRELEIAPSLDGPYSDVDFRTTEDYMEPTRLQTATVTKELLAGDGRSARVAIRTEDPLPLSILSIIPRIEYGEA